MYLDSKESDGGYFIKEAVVTQLKIGPPPEGQFALKFDKGTKFHYEETLGPYYVLPQAQTIHVTQLPELYQRVVAAAREEGAAEEPARGWPWWGWALLGLAAVAGGYLLYRLSVRKAG